MAGAAARMGAAARSSRASGTVAGVGGGGAGAGGGGGAGVRRRGRRVVLVVAGAVAVVVAGAAGVVLADKGRRRIATFWAGVVPVVARYKWAEVQLARGGADEATRAAAYEALHKEYAPYALAHVLRMRGIFVKVRYVRGEVGG